MADGRGYRVTRASFDVISVFGCLGAAAVPGPIFEEVLRPRGYSPSNVRNHLVRLARSDVLISSRRGRGRVSVHRRSPLIDDPFVAVSGSTPAPEWAGRFPALLVQIPEHRRSDHARPLLDALASTGGIPDGLDVCELVPSSAAQAREWTRRAFELDALAADVDRIVRGVDRVRATPGLTERAFFDVFYEVARVVLRIPRLPEELLAGAHAARIRDAHRRMHELGALWGERFAQDVFTRVLASPHAKHLEFDPAHWERIGLPVPVPARS